MEFKTPKQWVISSRSKKPAWLPLHGHSWVVSPGLSPGTFRIHPWSSQAGWPWTRYLISQSFSWFIYVRDDNKQNLLVEWLWGWSTVHSCQHQAQEAFGKCQPPLPPLSHHRHPWSGKAFPRHLFLVKQNPISMWRCCKNLAVTCRH